MRVAGVRLHSAPLGRETGKGERGKVPSRDTLCLVVPGGGHPHFSPFIQTGTSSRTVPRNSSSSNAACEGESFRVGFFMAWL